MSQLFWKCKYPWAKEPGTVVQEDSTSNLETLLPGSSEVQLI